MTIREIMEASKAWVDKRDCSMQQGMLANHEAAKVEYLSKVVEAFVSLDPEQHGCPPGLPGCEKEGGCRECLLDWADEQASK